MAVLSISQRLSEARKIITNCFGSKGVWASPTRYKYQCWTRDFAIAIEEALFDLGESEIVKIHLDELAKRQYIDGRIPIMFLDKPLKWLVHKVWNSMQNGRMSFLLKQYFSKDGIGQLSPWTRDSEFLYVLAVLQYSNFANEESF